jgi:IS5 family transposase
MVLRNIGRKLEKEIFLEEMDQIISWKELTLAIAPYYPNPKGAGRRRVGLSATQWFELSDPAVGGVALI